uniref:hypothetical protein n=1 Tax=Altererythrobacter segetis TaxID=1104773 RepID=UPI00140C3E09|nr:hypothetical protein [Altererythrobacter segetis]
MQIPDRQSLEANLREAVVLKAEELLLTGGGTVGRALAELLSGVESGGGLPTDEFGDAEALATIDPSRLEISSKIWKLCELLEARSLSGRPADGRVDSDAIEQDYLDFIELFLASLPDIALGGEDWTSCRNGAVRQLLLVGKAWHHLQSAIDEGTSGDFSTEQLTAFDVSLLAGIGERTTRNLVGPNKQLRSIEHKKQRKSSIDPRGFVAVNRIDALSWLRDRTDFRIASVRPGLFAERLGRIPDDIDRDRGAYLAALAIGKRTSELADEVGLPASDLRALASGHPSRSSVRRISDHVIAWDLERTSYTAPA